MESAVDQNKSILWDYETLNEDVNRLLREASRLTLDHAQPEGKNCIHDSRLLNAEERARSV
jgi:CHASE3 domain sensor protein